MNDRLLGYFAGLFDGEGHIYVTKQNHGSVLGVRIGVSNTDRRPLTMLKDVFGGGINKLTAKDRCRPCFAWQLDGNSAEAFLRTVRPWLVIKAERADLALKLQATKQNHRGVRLDDTTKAVRQSIRDQIQHLNDVGEVTP